MTWDYIIVGGGSAGCAIANKLSENPKNKILLLEAGGSHQSSLVKIPFFTIFTMPFWFKNWHYYTTPQPGLNNRKGYQPRGKVLGGSSAINAMIYIRGQAEDYDQWAKTSSPEWSWKQVFPIFKSFENNNHIQDEYHGQEGPLYVSNLKQPSEASFAFLEAAKACGHEPNDDFNGKQQSGVGLYQVTQNGGERHTAANAFIDPIASRENLSIIYHARTLKLSFNKKRCTGVIYHRHGKVHTANAKKKVILAAGAINSPQILLLSGVGPKNELAKHGIDCVHDLPGVGKNFHDHPDYIFNYKSKHQSLIGMGPTDLWSMGRAFLDYKKSKKRINDN